MEDHRRGPGAVTETLWTQDRIQGHILTARQMIAAARERKDK